MAEILDLIAKVSWQTNQADLDKLNKAIDKQDELLTELIRKGQRLEQQRAKTDNPARAKELNRAMEANKKAIDSITAAQQKQSTQTVDLINKQKQLAKAIAEATDPKQARQLLSEFKKIEGQIKSTEKSASGFGSKLGSIGQSIAGGLGLSVGSMGLESLVSGISSFVTSANAEFIDAEKTSLRLQNTLKNLGKEQYFDELTNEAQALADTIGYLDNDDIVSAQQKLLVYGKVSQAEMSKLLPLIIDLAAKMETDVPTATETMISILEGRGGQALRQVGISIKDAKTTTERLGVVFEELGPKIAGSSEQVRKSSEGMQLVLDQQIKDLQENLGASTIELRNFILEGYAGFLRIMDNMFTSAEDKRKKQQKTYADERLNDAKKLTDKELEFEKTLLLTKVDDIKVAQTAISKIEAENAQSGFKYIGKLRINENNKEIQAKKDFVKRRESEVQAIITEANTREQRIAENNSVAIQRNADERAEAQKEALDKQAKASQSAADAESKRVAALSEAIRKDREELDAYRTNKDANEIEKVNAKYDELKRQAKGYAKLLAEIEKGRASALLHIERDKQFELAKLEFIGVKNKEDSEAKKVEVENNTAFVSMRNLVEKQQAEILDKQKRKERNAEEARMLFDSLQMAASAAQSIISIEQEKNDRLIALQEDRVAQARDNASASVKIEEDRLNMLLEKRQKYERTQRAIDAAIIVANQAVAISAAIASIAKEGAKLGPIGIAAQVIAIGAGLLGAIAAVRGAASDIPAFREGGYTGDGDPDSTSTAIGPRPYTYHKKEFVMDEGLTNKHRELFDGLHKREMVVKKLDDGQFYITRNGLDTTRLIDDHISIKNQMQTDNIVYHLNAINEKLSQREVTINNTFDSLGFGNVIATQLGRIEINKKLR